ALIRAQGTIAVSAPGPATTDLAAALDQFGTRAQVHVALPAGAVPLPAEATAELAAVVGACLDNVAAHAGADAPAWVLLEDLGDRVEISVRDEGPGIAPGRLDEAVTEGRLGVAQSIRGRMADL